LLTRASDGLGGDVSDACRVLAEDVGVDAQGHGGVSVAEPCGYHVNRDSGEQQCGRVQMAQIMESSVRQRLGPGSDRLVVLVDQLGDERGHGVGVERFAPPARIAAPSGASEPSLRAVAVPSRC